MNGRFDWWCRTAVDLIRYGPDREEVYRELYAHLTDRYETELDRWEEPREAEEAVLRAMGSASELAPQLAAIHRPFWGYVLTLSRWVLWGLVVLAVVTGGAFLYYNAPGEAYVPWFYENPGELLRSVSADGTGESIRVMDFNPEARDSSDGFNFDVTRAVMVFHDHYTDDTLDQYTFWFQVEVSSFWQWAELECIPEEDFWAVDSLGNVYGSYSNDGWTWQQSVSGNVNSTGLFTHTMDLWLNNFCSEHAEWIELRYDRDGRDIRLRIDLTGGDGA